MCFVGKFVGGMARGHDRGPFVDVCVPLRTKTLATFKKLLRIWPRESRPVYAIGGGLASIWVMRLGGFLNSTVQM